MSETTKIQWTDSTWNPVRARRKDNGKTGWHCQKVSSGCAHCYSEVFNGRNLPGGGTGLPYTAAGREQVEIFIQDELLRKPLSWKKPRMIFVCSMTDLFGDFVSDEMIERVFDVMRQAEQHTFQVLTKRIRRAAEFLAGKDPLPNVWVGCSIEDQRACAARLPFLKQVKAAVRFISFEPLLEDVHANLEGIDWAIIGGESGTGARPCDFAWIKHLIERCQRDDVAPFVKQAGSRPTEFGEPLTIRLKHPKGGDMSEWPAELKVREWPEQGGVAC